MTEHDEKRTQVATALLLGVAEELEAMGIDRATIAEAFLFVAVRHGVLAEGEERWAEILSVFSRGLTQDRGRLGLGG